MTWRTILFVTSCVWDWEMTLEKIIWDFSDFGSELYCFMMVRLWQVFKLKYIYAELLLCQAGLNQIVIAVLHEHQFKWSSCNLTTEALFTARCEEHRLLVPVFVWNCCIILTFCMLHCVWVWWKQSNMSAVSFLSFFFCSSGWHSKSHSPKGHEGITEALLLSHWGLSQGS